MKAKTLIEVIDAAALSHWVESPFKQRGALMFVGPPGTLKTSIIKAALEDYPNALFLSDLNVNSLMSLRETLVSGRYTTIAFPEFEKLYARKADTASNIEAHLKQLIEEGFTRASFEEQDAIACTARTLVIGAMTTTFYSQHIKRWNDNGFKRRILWCGMRLHNSNMIMDAIRKWETIPLDGIQRRVPRSMIKYDLTEEDSKLVEKILQGQWEATPYVLLKKIYCVLRWKYKEDKQQPLRILKEFSEGLNNQMAEIFI